MRFRFLILFLLVAGCCRGQSASRSLPFQVSVFRQDVALPFVFSGKAPWHWGAMVGTRLPLSGRASTFFVPVNAGYFSHRHLARNVVVQSGIGYAWRILGGLETAVGFDLGGQLVMPFKTAYRIDEEGRPTVVAGYRKLRATGGFHLELRAHWARGSSAPAAWVRYNAWVQYPFSPGFIPVLPHTAIHTGLSFPLR